MSRKRRLNGKHGCFFIANFSNHNNIWILAQNTAQAVRECIIYFWPYLRLAYTTNIVFNWIFQRDHIILFSVELFHHGRKRRGLSRTSGPRKKNESVWTPKHTTKRLKIFWRKPKSLKR